MSEHTVRERYAIPNQLLFIIYNYFLAFISANPLIIL